MTDLATGDPLSGVRLTVGTAASVYSYAQGINDGGLYNAASVPWAEPVGNGAYSGDIAGIITIQVVRVASIELI